MSTNVLGAAPAAPATVVPGVGALTLTPDQIAHLAAVLQGRRAERPSKEELAAMPYDQQEDALRGFYLEHDTDDPADVKWRYERGQVYAIKDHEGRYHPWNIYQASDPANEEVPIAEFHDYHMRMAREDAERQQAAVAHEEQLRAEADEREIQRQVDEMTRQAAIKAEAERRFEAQQAAAAKVKQAPKASKAA